MPPPRPLVPWWDDQGEDAAVPILRRDRRRCVASWTVVTVATCVAKWRVVARRPNGRRRRLLRRYYYLEESW